MSNILDRLKNLGNERPSVLRTADPVVSRSKVSKKGKSRKTVILFVAILIACCALGYQFKSRFYPVAPAAAAPVADPAQFENQKNDLAIATFKQGEFSKSVEAFETLVKEHPERAEFHVNLAMAYQQLSKFDKAQEQLQLAVTLDPKDSYAHNNLGLLALQTKQMKLAEKSFTQAYELNSESPEITLNLASYFEKTGQLKKSVVTYQKYLTLPKADQKTAELIKKRIPRLNSLSVQEEDGT